MLVYQRVGFLMMNVTNACRWQGIPLSVGSWFGGPRLLVDVEPQSLQGVPGRTWWPVLSNFFHRCLSNFICIYIYSNPRIDRKAGNLENIRKYGEHIIEPPFWKHISVSFWGALKGGIYRTPLDFDGKQVGTVLGGAQLMRWPPTANHQPALALVDRGMVSQAEVGLVGLVKTPLWGSGK